MAYKLIVDNEKLKMMKKFLFDYLPLRECGYGEFELDGWLKEEVFDGREVQVNFYRIN